MQELKRQRQLPNMEKLGLLTATILLTYAIGQFLTFPRQEVTLQLPGLYLVFQFNTPTIITLIVAGMTASGAVWLFRDHPGLGRRNTMEHWLLPALVALVIGLPLFQTKLQPLWWIGFFLGSALLILVLVAEYIVIDPEDTRQPLAVASLTIVAYALFLVLAIVLRYSGYRLFLLLPFLTLGGGLVCLRYFRLRFPNKNSIIPAGVITLVLSQITAALHYWPISPVSFSLALLGPAYCLSCLIGNILEDQPAQRAVVEPLFLLVIIWGTAIIMA